MAIGRISSHYPVYVPTTETDWLAVHAARTEIAPDLSYVETEGDWTGVHTSYDDVFIPSEPDEVEPLPDLQAMWATVYGAEPRNLDDSVISATGSVSASGTLNFTLQRQEDGPPPTDVRVSVLGTPISTWQKFPSGSSLTIDMAVPGMPPGVHTVEVEAYAGGRLVGTTQFTVVVAGSPAQAAAPAPAQPEPPAAENPLADSPLELPPPPSGGPAPRVVPGLRSEPGAASAVPASPPPTAPLPGAAAAAPVTFTPPAPLGPRPPGAGTGVYVGGQAMAWALAMQTPASGAPEAERGIAPVLEASAGDQGEGRRQPQHQRPEDDEAQGK